jgi:hypothetical protein
VGGTKNKNNSYRNKNNILTMDLDGEDTFPSISIFLVGLAF